MFMWRPCYDWIPTHVTFRVHRVPSDVLCLRQLEYTFYALWGCLSRVAYLHEVIAKVDNLQAANLRSSFAMIDFCVYIYIYMGKWSPVLKCDSMFMLMLTGSQAGRRRIGGGHALHMDCQFNPLHVPLFQEMNLVD
ncbi:hypothetical protein ACOSP7_026926 [Xanthoceras sorbifolium]